MSTNEPHLSLLKICGRSGIEHLLKTLGVDDISLVGLRSQVDQMRHQFKVVHR